MYELSHTEHERSSVVTLYTSQREPKLVCRFKTIMKQFRRLSRQDGVAIELSDGRGDYGGSMLVIRPEMLGDCFSFLL